jgi:UPF0755 protein
VDDDSNHLLFGDVEPYDEPPRRERRTTRQVQGGRRRKRRLVLVLALLAAVVVGVSALVVVPKVVGLFSVPDYSGQGSGRAVVVVSPGDTASDIAGRLVKAGVVKSSKAFVNAANDNPAAGNIQPGTYVLRHHMSGQNALQLMLDPSSRSRAGDVVVTEGATSFDVEKRLIQVLGAKQKAAVQKAFASVGSLGVPLGYHPPHGTSLASVEGFLYPATYTLDPSSSPAEILQNMTTRFAEHDRSTGFANDAKTLGLTPYEALIIASIAQAEARFPDDMPKVVRVILNRLAADRPLQIDATTRYGARLNGVDPSSVSYDRYDSPYNSYLHEGLPPTPISNPGAEALDAAVHPAAGDWMYYVNSDAAGHLFFTDSETAFAAAVAKCRANHWGCA